MKKSKRFLESAEKVDKHKLYTKEEAVKLVNETATTKFDSLLK